MDLLLHELGVDEASRVLDVDDLVHRDLAKRHVHRDVGERAAAAIEFVCTLIVSCAWSWLARVEVVVGLEGELGQGAHDVAHHVKDLVVAKAQLALGARVQVVGVVEDLSVQRLTRLLHGSARDIGLARRIGARVIGSDVGVLERHDVDVLGVDADGLCRICEKTVSAPWPISVAPI